MKIEADAVRFSWQADRPAGPFHYTDPRKIPEETQCIIVLGGDGTLLQAARDIQAAHNGKRSQIPLLGVNLGNLGFLAEVDRQSVYQALDKLLGGCLRGRGADDALRARFTGEIRSSAKTLP